MSKWTKFRAQIPIKVQVKSRVFYEVVWVEAFPDDCVGKTDYEKRQIILKLGQTNKETVLTYLHELAHAISGEYDINLTENQVQGIEKSLYYVLKDANIFKESI